MQQEASHVGDEFILLIHDFVATFQGLPPDWGQEVYRHYHSAFTNKEFRVAISNGVENTTIPEFPKHRTAITGDLRDVVRHAADFNGKMVGYLLSSSDPLEELLTLMIHYEHWGFHYLGVSQKRTLRYILEIE